MAADRSSTLTKIIMSATCGDGVESEVSSSSSYSVTTMSESYWISVCSRLKVLIEQQVIHGYGTYLLEHRKNRRRPTCLSVLTSMTRCELFLTINGVSFTTEMNCKISFSLVQLGFEFEFLFRVNTRFHLATLYKGTISLIAPRRTI